MTDENVYHVDLDKKEIVGPATWGERFKTGATVYQFVDEFGSSVHAASFSAVWSSLGVRDAWVKIRDKELKRGQEQ